MATAWSFCARADKGPADQSPREQNACNTIIAHARKGAMPGIEAWAERLPADDLRSVDFSRFLGLDLIPGGAP